MDYDWQGAFQFQQIRFLFIFPLTPAKQIIIMETKKEGFVSIMRDAIVQAAIESLRQEGLRFSVDTLSNKMKISKKTVYKYFPDKETLALAIYEKYYSDAAEKAKKLIDKNTADSHRELLQIYFDSKVMTCNNIFNKYKLNQTVYTYTARMAESLWAIIAMSFHGQKSDTERKSLQIIVDGSFEKLCNLGASSDDVIERLMKLLW